MGHTAIPAVGSSRERGGARVIAPAASELRSTRHDVSRVKTGPLTPLLALTAVIYGWVFAPTLTEDRPILAGGTVDVYGTVDGSEG